MNAPQSRDDLRRRDAPQATSVHMLPRLMPMPNHLIKHFHLYMIVLYLRGIDNICHDLKHSFSQFIIAKIRDLLIIELVVRQSVPGLSE